MLLVPTGAAALVFSVANNSFVQLGVEPQMRGRVMALYFMCFMGGTPVGAPVIGWIAEHFGAPWGLILGGGVCVVAGLAAGGVLARGRRVRLEAGLAPPRLQLRVGRAAAVDSAAAARRRGGRRRAAPGAAVALDRLAAPTGVRVAPSSTVRRRAMVDPLLQIGGTVAVVAALDRAGPGRPAAGSTAAGSGRRAAAAPRAGRRPLQVVAADVRRLGRQIALVPAGHRWRAVARSPRPTTTC